ncbi:5-oxoprolinase subunit PxpA [Flavitalea sp.]|nr:5-oxoprolinase subunit PxpA [Flavitalea sp.]
MIEVDLNCDMGESPGSTRYSHDEELMQYVSSVNIACGFHAGDAAIMYKTVAAAIQKNVAIGAHPGLQDLQGFGRRNMAITPNEAYQITLYQLGALAGFVKVAGGNLHHVKPHGALYNMAAENKTLSNAIAEAIADFDNSLILYGLAGSKLIEAGKQKGLRTANEVFADRTYQSNGFLTPRSEPGSMITNPEAAVEQVISMVKNHFVISTDNTKVTVQADTICIHGDTEHAIEFAKAISQGLKIAGINLKKL